MPKEIALDNIHFDRQLLLGLGRLFADIDGTCILYSGGSFDSAQRSFLGLFPFVHISIKDNKLYKGKLNSQSRVTLDITNPWDGLKSMLPDKMNESFIPEWIGYIGYETGMYSDPEKVIAHKPSKIPDVYLQKCSVVLVIDHSTNKGTVHIEDQAQYILNEDHRHWVQRLGESSQWEDLAKNLESYVSHVAVQQPIVYATSQETFEEYIKKIQTAQQLIHAGDIYQVNLSQQFLMEGKRDPYQLFSTLVNENPAPFSAFLRLKDFSVVSSSPERFLRKSEGILETRPIKGTMPRGKTPEEDKRNLDQLMNSAKDKSELLMITDLMRNDLGKVSLPGSVVTKQIWNCEAYENVFHLLSIIQSKPLPGLHPIDIIRSCFPGGSTFTGCPKLSAMEVISTLENRPRGIYTGSIGYIAGNGDFDFNIAIRTVVVTENQVDIQLGGAIVADSDPRMEYEETLHKGATIFRALGIEPARSKMNQPA